jgi:hypothetical protein
VSGSSLFPVYSHPRLDINRITTWLFPPLNAFTTFHSNNTYHPPIHTLVTMPTGHVVVHASPSGEVNPEDASLLTIALHRTARQMHHSADPRNRRFL